MSSMLSGFTVVDVRDPAEMDENSPFDGWAPPSHAAW
jgi:hypothetical protein